MGLISIATIWPLLLISFEICDQPPGLAPISSKVQLFFINLNFLFSSINLNADLAL